MAKQYTPELLRSRSQCAAFSYCLPGMRDARETHNKGGRVEQHEGKNVRPRALWTQSIQCCAGYLLRDDIHGERRDRGCIALASRPSCL
eukprot:1190860-Prorocentrum_minimum.AAC.7